jgi:hypothetical protein
MIEKLKYFFFSKKVCGSLRISDGTLLENHFTFYLKTWILGPCCQGILWIRVGIPPLSEIVPPVEFRNRNENG